MNIPNSKPLFENISIRSRGRLPHWEAEKATCFVTFRLADSLPSNILDDYRFEREDIIKTAEALGRELSISELARLDELYSEKVETYLDAGCGACHLTDPPVAQAVKGALLHFDGIRYHLLAWCIMPNHVHAVLRSLGEHRLADIMHSWKSFTAKKANRLLRRTRALWQREYYDHLVRDEIDFYRILEYVVDNPRKSGLQNWPWFGISSAGILPASL